MRFQYDDEFVESAVSIRASSQRFGPPSLQIRRFHSVREKLYSVLDPDKRNDAFFKLHLEWFREWGLEQMLLNAANEFPRFSYSLAALVFRKARAKNDEGAELYVNAELSRSGVVAFCVERFELPEDLHGFLRHEFTHLDDMTNPSFGYSPQLHLPGANPAQQRLARERYRLLWDITIDGRLAASCKNAKWKREYAKSQIPEGRAGSHRNAFDDAFSFWPQTRRDEVFDLLWTHPEPRHDELMAIAADPRDLRSSHEPLPGAACPLCSFSTFAWADLNSISPETLASVQREFPDWTIDQGACNRCIEIYRRNSAEVCSVSSI